MNARIVSVGEGRRLARSITVGPHALTADVKSLRLTSGLEPCQVKQLLAVAGRCPVHRLLTREVPVVTVPTVMTRPSPPFGRTLPQTRSGGEPQVGVGCLRDGSSVRSEAPWKYSALMAVKCAQRSGTSASGKIASTGQPRRPPHRPDRRPGRRPGHRRPGALRHGLRP